MECEVKLEPPMDFAFEDVGESDPFTAGPSRNRKRPFPQDNGDSSFRLPDVTSSSIEAMHFILRQWGLEALEKRFDEHLIDVNVLDYILDADIVELCRDFPIRYRLVLRRNIKNKYYNMRSTIPTSQSKPRSKRSRQTIITFAKDPMQTLQESSEKENTETQHSYEDDTPPTHFVSVETQLHEDRYSDGTESGQEEEESVRDILARDAKFQPVLAILDNGLIPDSAGLCHMNRILMKHFFEERILVEKKYPKVQEKQDLALKILETFPHLEKTRVSPDAPKESYFFWVNAGKGKGPHTGLIETKTANMRKEVPPEERRFRRRGTVNIVLSDNIRERATEIASLVPLPENEDTISNGMAECMDLHSCLLQQGDSNAAGTVISTFPHLLSYGGRMIVQTFQRMHTYYNSSADLDRFLRLGLLLDERSFYHVENKYIKGALRIMKKLIMNSKKEDAEDMSSDEAEASPLIRWLKRKDNEQDVSVVQRHVSELSYLAPHIVCIADVFKEGNLFVVFQGHFIPCGNSATHALDVFFKLFAVLGISVPVLLRKIHELMMVHLWKISNSCKNVTVTRLITRLNEIDDTSGEGGSQNDNDFNDSM